MLAFCLDALAGLAQICQAARLLLPLQVTFCFLVRCLRCLTGDVEFRCTPLKAALFFSLLDWEAHLLQSLPDAGAALAALPPISPGFALGAQGRGLLCRGASKTAAKLRSFAQRSAQRFRFLPILLPACQQKAETPKNTPGTGLSSCASTWALDETFMEPHCPACHRAENCRTSSGASSACRSL